MTMKNAEKNVLNWKLHALIEFLMIRPPRNQMINILSIWGRGNEEGEVGNELSDGSTGHYSGSHASNPSHSAGNLLQAMATCRSPPSY